MDKTKKEGFMKRLKILAVVLALGALCMGVLSGCDNGKNGSETGEDPFYTLQEAYERRIVDKNDLMHISYFLCGGVYVGDEKEWSKIDFIPSESKGNLDDLTARIIKQMYYDQNKNLFKDMTEQTALEHIEISNFGGNYDGGYVLSLFPDFMQYGTGSYIEVIDGIVLILMEPQVMVANKDYIEDVGGH